MVQIGANCSERRGGKDSLLALAVARVLVALPQEFAGQDKVRGHADDLHADAADHDVRPNPGRLIAVLELLRGDAGPSRLKDNCEQVEQTEDDQEVLGREPAVLSTQGVDEQAGDRVDRRGEQVGRDQESGRGWRRRASAVEGTRGRRRWAGAHAIC